MRSKPDAGTGAGAGGSSRAVFATLVRALGLMLLGVAVLAPVIGYLIGGAPAMWGALVGGGVGLLCGVLDAGIMWATSHRPLYVTMGLLVGSWALKMLAVLAVTLLVRSNQGISVLAYAVVAVGAIILATLTEMIVVFRARLPYVETKP